MRCPFCQSENIFSESSGVYDYECDDCGHGFNEPDDDNEDDDDFSDDEVDDEN